MDFDVIEKLSDEEVKDLYDNTVKSVENFYESNCCIRGTCSGTQITWGCTYSCDELIRKTQTSCPRTYALIVFGLYFYDSSSSCGNYSSDSDLSRCRR